MRVGLIIYGSLETLSGGYLYDRMLVRHLRAAGCDVDIISQTWRDYVPRLGDNLDLDAARRIAGAHFDVLLQDELNHPSLFLWNRAFRRISATPIVTIVHHLRSSEAHPAYLLPLYRAVERQYLNSVTGFIYNSHTTRRTVQALAGRAEPGIVALPAANHLTVPAHTTVLTALAQRARSHDPLQLMFVGNLMARKGLHEVLDALALLDTRAWHLHIIGSEAVDPEYSVSMRQRARAYGLDSHITWHGRVSDSELTRLLLGGDLLVMPAYEGFGIAFLEAMAFGMPVVAANIGAAPEVVRHGVNGYLAPGEDPAALARSIDLLASNRSQLAALGFYARQHFEAHPTWDMTMRGVYAWLHETVT